MRSSFAPLSCVTFALVLVLALGQGEARADGVHVKLRGVARIDAYGVRADGGDLMLRGALVDDAQAPLAGENVIVTLARASSPREPLLLTGTAAPRSCAGDNALVPGTTQGAHLVTDSTGRFCLRVAVPLDRYVAHVAYGGSDLVDGAQIDDSIDLKLRTCTLLFSPEPRVVRLDVIPFGLDAAAMLESDGLTTPGAGFGVSLSTESGGAPIATATTDASGRAHFSLSPSALGPPGRGELRLTFAGNADTAPASYAAPIERHARVALDVAGAESGRLPAGSPEEGIPLTVRARALGGDVASGSVEARVGDIVVGVAPVESGAAKLLVAFGLPESSGAADEVNLSLRYVPTAPWYEPGAESQWQLPVKGRSPLRQAWILAAGLAVAACFVVMRVQRARAMAVIPPRPRPVSRGEAKLDVVRVAGEGEGWKGRVTDADDGSPIAAARVTIERPAFGRAEVLGSAVADEDGAFELPLVSYRLGDELSFESPFHVGLRRPLPAPGELDAQLIQRRRALLGRMVAWARLRGRPFDARPEPTPGHVRRAAGGSFDVVRWADAVERAAFAGEPVDARLEAEIDRLAPGAPRPPDMSPPAKSPPGRDRRALANPTRPNR